MEFDLIYTDASKAVFLSLQNDPSKKSQYKSVGKALYLMQADLRHPGLNTHEFSSLSKTMGCKVFESYAQNNTPGAYRIFWRYGPGKKQITILSITQHP